MRTPPAYEALARALADLLAAAGAESVGLPRIERDAMTGEPYAARFSVASRGVSVRITVEPEPAP